jgi:peptidyl-prolyl cis-trans isomerase SurA
MKTFLIIIFILLTSNISNGVEIKIVHKIQNQIITNVDIKNEMRYLLVFNQNLKELDRETIFNISNESLIRQKIKKIEIKKKYKKNSLSEEYLAVLTKKAYSNLELNSLEEFYSYLKKNNLDIDNFIEKITIETFWNQLIVAKYNNQVTIDKNKIL